MNRLISWAAVVMLALGTAGPPAQAQVCAAWKEAVHSGGLDSQLSEASGLAASRRFPGRLYHVNDSGDTGRFYLTDMAGSKTRAVEIIGFRPQDAEALAVGPCAGDGSCVFIGDIGDNRRKRQSIEIAVVDEVENFPRSVKSRRVLKLQYPDGPHDAESMAVHPDGTIFILTKESPARLFRASFQSGSGIQTMVAVAALETAGAPTDMAISDDGMRMLVLTYLSATEFGIDFVKFATPRYRQQIPIQFLQQQEAVSYLAGSRSFIYTTEQLILPAWIMRVDCQTK